MGPIPEGRVALDEMNPDTFPVRRDAVPGAYFGTAGQWLLTQATRFRWGYDPGYTAWGSRHRASKNTTPADL